MVDIKRQRGKNKLFRDVAQWLAYQSGGLGAGGSSPPIPIFLRLFLLYSSTEMDMMESKPTLPLSSVKARFSEDIAFTTLVSIISSSPM